MRNYSADAAYIVQAFRDATCPDELEAINRNVAVQRLTDAIKAAMPERAEELTAAHQSRAEDFRRDAEYAASVTVTHAPVTDLAETEEAAEVKA